MPQPKREEKIKWEYIGFPDFLMRELDEVIKANRYPRGRWHGRTDFAVYWVKFGIRQAKDRSSEESGGETIKKGKGGEK